MLLGDNPRVRSPSDFSIEDEINETSPSPNTSSTSVYLCCPRPSLELTLENKAVSPFTLQEFKAFVRNNHCSEPLEFYYDVVKYIKDALRNEKETDDNHKQMTQQDEDDLDMHLRNSWERIMLVYINTSAPKELNITSESRTAMLDLQHATYYPPRTPMILDRVLEFAIMTLRESAYAQFVNEQQVGLVLDTKYAQRASVMASSPPVSRNSSIPSSDNDDSSPIADYETRYSDNMSPVSLTFDKNNEQESSSQRWFGETTTSSSCDNSNSNSNSNNIDDNSNQASHMASSFSDEEANIIIQRNSPSSHVGSSFHSSASSTRRFSFLRSLRSSSTTSQVNMDPKVINPRTLPGDMAVEDDQDTEDNRIVHHNPGPGSLPKSNWREVSRKLKLKLH